MRHRRGGKNRDTSVSQAQKRKRIKKKGCNAALMPHLMVVPTTACTWTSWMQHSFTKQKSVHYFSVTSGVTVSSRSVCRSIAVCRSMPFGHLWLCGRCNCCLVGPRHDMARQGLAGCSKAIDAESMLHVLLLTALSFARQTRQHSRETSSGPQLRKKFHNPRIQNKVSSDPRQAKTSQDKPKKSAKWKTR